MGQFPRSERLPVRVYDIITPGGDRRGRFDLARLRDLLFDRLLPTRVPPSLDSREAIQWGWYWPDGRNPISSNEWLMWGVRVWRKRPPGSLVRAMTAEKVRELKDANEQVPPARVKEIKAAIREDLTGRQPPAIEEGQILIDTVGYRVFLFASSETVCDEILDRMRRTIQAQVHPEANFRQWTLRNYLASTRPGIVVPSDAHQRFIQWLTAQAASGQWCVATEDAEKPHTSFRVSLDDELRLVDVHGGKVSVSGDQTTAETVERMATTLLGEGEEPAKIVTLSVHLETAAGRSMEVKLDPDGVMLACRVETAAEVEADEDELEADVLLRASDFDLAAKLVRLLWVAYDVGPFLESDPQLKLFPGEPTGDAQWMAEAPTGPVTTARCSPRRRSAARRTPTPRPSSPPTPPSSRRTSSA